MSYHVLIVEDEPSLSDYVKKELIFEDYQVSTAFDGFLLWKYLKLLSLLLMLFCLIG